MGAPKKHNNWDRIVCRALKKPQFFSDGRIVFPETVANAQRRMLRCVLNSDRHKTRWEALLVRSMGNWVDAAKKPMGIN